ncbi:MAG: PQQ-binding-like beta-propeller repeat protein [Tannerella sp.]|nr:PQQ-binding-like beta-propeller repeat protein [Tannerella sp.]
MKKYLFFVACFGLLTLFSCQQRSVNQVNDDSAPQLQWRGENRDGIYNESGLLKIWPENGPELLWSYEELGAGFTSPAISNEKLYITGLEEDKLILFVFDLQGNLLVKKEVGKEENVKWPGPRSTITINNGKLYIYNALGELFCLNEQTLDEVWKKALFTEFDGRTTEWGMNESPLIVGDRLFITPGGIENNIIALNKNTGDLIWSSPGKGTLSAYCSPQYIDDQSIPIIVTSTAEYIVGVNADTGELLWSIPQQHEYNIHPNTPLYYNGMILSTAGYRVGTVMLRLKDGGKAVDEVWRNDEMDNQIGGAVKVGDYVYASGHQHRYWFCVDWNTGETRYKVTDIAPCNVIFADSMLYCYSEKGTMNLVKPNPDHFEPVSSFNVTLGTEQHWAHPVIYKRVMYLRHGDALMAYKIG